MKKFTFRLERVLEYRKLQADIEEGKLARLRRESEALATRQAELDSAWKMAQAAASAQPEERVWLSAYRRDYEHRRAKLTLERTRKNQELAAQQAVWVAAKQRAEVLAKVKAKQYQEWERGFQKELDDLAMDSFLARWKPPREGSAN